MANTIGFGFRSIFYGTRDTAGFLQCTASNGDQDGTPMQRLYGAESVDLRIPDAERVTIIGDDGPMVQFILDPSELPGGTMSTKVFNDSFAATATGTLVETIDNLSMTLLGAPGVTRADLVLAMHRQAKSWTGGASKWETVILPNSQVEPLFTSPSTRSEGSYEWSIAASNTDTLPWGDAIDNTANGATKAPLLYIAGDAPAFMQTWLGDGTETAFNFTFTPTDQADVSVYVDGTKKTVTTDYTVNTSTKVLTFVAAPAAAAKIVVLYEFNSSEL